MGSKKTTTTQSTDLPDFVTDASTQATALGSSIAKTPYQPYREKRVADLSGNEKSAINLAASGNGRAQQFVDQGTSLLEAGKDWGSATDAERKAYEEPIFNAITRPALDNANKSYDKARTNLTSNQAMLSAKGQDQYNLASQALDKNLNQTTSDVTAQGQAQAYDAASQQWGQDQQRMEDAAAAYRAVGGDITKLNAQQIQDLMATGGIDRGVEQQNLDFNYGQYQEGQNWDANNLKALLASLQGTQGSYDYTQTGTQKQSGGTFGQILGGVTSLAGAYYGGAFGGAGGLGGKATSVGTAMSDWANKGGPINLVNGNTPAYMVG